MGIVRPDEDREMIVDKRTLMVLAVLGCIGGGLTAETKKADKPPARLTRISHRVKCVLPEALPLDRKAL